MGYNHLSGITIRYFAALDCFAKSYIDQGCVIYYHSVCICCSFLYLYLVQECHAAVTLLLSEACLFVIRMKDSFEFHVGKSMASYLFGFDMR